MSDNKIKIRLLKSTIGTPRKIREVVFALGLRRPNSEVIHNASPTIMGMVKKTKHMIHVTEL
ncbi:MAG: 50S ribosomal protein L30 [Nitrospirae bacterium]|nr:50S ribosomal protein L30 [Nitrospirota bacterium]MCL5284441.1 50S ribosomal protein L30 [Nitrospirota bacterium]